MNTTFNPSTFDKQAAASLDMIDEEAARKRVEAILDKQAGPTLTPEAVNSGGIGKALKEAQIGPTLTPAPMTEWSRYVNTLPPASQTQPQAPATRKKRSDAGIPKKAPADPDEIVLRIPLAEARAIGTGTTGPFFREWVQDQIIAQLQRRLDLLQKGKS